MKSLKEMPEKTRKILTWVMTGLVLAGFVIAVILGVTKKEPVIQEPQAIEVVVDTTSVDSLVVDTVAE